MLNNNSKSSVHSWQLAVTKTANCQLKTANYKKMHYYTNLILLALVLLLGCNATPETQPEMESAITEIEIPALLDRAPALRQGTEWDGVQSAYMRKAAYIRTENAEAVQERIELALVFMNEARVTGEHGHYYPAALRVLDEALEYNDGQDENLEFAALSAKASVQLSQHEFKEALATAEAAAAINPYNAQIYGALVDAHVELGHYAEAVAMADKMISIRPDLRSYSRASYLREIHGDVEGAIEAMQMAVDAGYPGREQTAWARLTLGELYQRYNQPKMAKAEYERILAERPDYPFAIAALADLSYAAGDYAKAEELLIEAAEIIPEVGFYVQLAELYQTTGRQEDFSAAITEIEFMLQDDVNSGHNMDLEYAALHYELLDDVDRALVYAAREYQKRPENIDVNRLMARLHQAKGDATAARDYLERAERTASRHPELEEVRSQLASL